MAQRKQHDPLACIPSPKVVRPEMEAAQDRANRLRALLQVSEQVHADPQDVPQYDDYRREVWKLMGEVSQLTRIVYELMGRLDRMQETPTEETHE